MCPSYGAEFRAIYATPGSSVGIAQREGDIVGDAIIVGFGVLTFVGIGLLTLGILRGPRILIVVGTVLLLALAGAWMLGLPGAALGLVGLVFLRRGRANAPPGDR